VISTSIANTVSCSEKLKSSRLYCSLPTLTTAESCHVTVQHVSQHDHTKQLQLSEVCGDSVSWWSYHSLHLTSVTCDPDVTVSSSVIHYTSTARVTWHDTIERLLTWTQEQLTVLCDWRPVSPVHIQHNLTEPATWKYNKHKHLHRHYWETAAWLNVSMCTGTIYTVSTKNCTPRQCTIDWLSIVLHLHQHNIGYTADGFYRSDDPTNNVR